MKGFRRNRPLYLAPSSSSDYDRRNDFDELDRQDCQFKGRCGSRLVQSIAKLNCGASTPKAETLMSQSEFTFENDDKTNYYLDHPNINPTTIYPSFLAPASVGHNLQFRSRRREDDSSDDALTAPRRFVSPSRLQSNAMFKDRTSQITRAFIACTGNSSNDAIPRKNENPVIYNASLLDIPECVVIPSIVASDEMDLNRNRSLSHDTSSDSNPQHEVDGMPFERNEFNESLQRSCSSHLEQEEKWQEILCPEQFEMKGDLYCEYAQTLHQDYSVPECSIGISHNPSAFRAVNLPQYSHATNASAEDEFLNQKRVDHTARTFFLASSSTETPKASLLSKKLGTHQRNISLQSSDTSFGTVKSGATLSTSQTTSTGLSRSSRKTQALIERFERHIISQKAMERLQSPNPK